MPEVFNTFYFPWEMDFLHAIQNIRSAPLDVIMKCITTLGNAGLLWITLAIILAIIPKTRKCGLTMGFAMVITFVIGNLVLKNILMRGRPCWVDNSVDMLLKIPKDFSFPSGHTMNGVTASLCLFFHYHKAGAAAIVMACAIAFSRMYVFVHWPTDIIGGALIGAIDAVISFVVVKKIFEAVSRKKQSKNITE